MCTYSKFATLAVSFALCAAAQNRLGPASTMHITFPDDSPLAVLSADWGESVATPSGGAMLLDLRTSLTLRNVSDRSIRGVTLLVLAQEVSPGGKASVSVPSIDVKPGDAFPVRLNLRLLRPQMSAEGPLVQIALDGVLYTDLSFYGPNRLNSRRSMTQWELEARRDRKFLKTLLETAGAEGIRQHMQDVQARLSEKPRMDVQVARGRTTNQEVHQQMRFAFLRMPEEPVRLREGSAAVSANEAHSPAFELQNVSNAPVKYIEIGWIMKSRQGEEFFAGTIPAEIGLLPSQTVNIQPKASLKVNQPNGRPASISGLSGFVNHVEFSDGRVWIPQREALEGSRLKQVMNPSPEEQRLSDLYRRKGLNAVVEELRKF